MLSFLRVSFLRHTLVASSLFASCITVSAQQRPNLDVPYIKTPTTVVERMLEIAEVDGHDSLIDLGSGDGRIPITAARLYGTQGLGVDIDPERTQEARAAASAAGVADLASFRTEDLFETDLSRATVISMYLFPEINHRLRPELLKLEPGTRIVSHAFHMDDWTPERHEVVDGRDIFLWTVPAQLEGLWRIHAQGYQSFVLRVWQQFDRVQATATTLDERSIPVTDMRLQGPDIHFSLNTTEGLFTFSGSVDGKTMTGESNRAGNWTAEKL